MPLTVTDRILADPPAFGVALAHVWPSAHATARTWSRRRRRQSPRSGSRTARRYTQIRLGPDGRPYVMEVAARLGGGHDAELCRVALGVDLNDLAISFALGEPIAASDGQSQALLGVGGACVLFLVAPEGVLRATAGVEEAEALDGRRVGADLPAARMAVRAAAARSRPRGRRFSPPEQTAADAVARARRAAEAVRFLVDAPAS